MNAGSLPLQDAARSAHSLIVGMGRKILLVSDWYPSPEDPVQGVFVEQQAVALSARHRVVVVVPRRRRWREGFGRRKRVSHETRNGIHVVTTDASPPLPKWPYATYSGVRHAVAAAWTEVGDGWGVPDLIHAHVVRYAGWASLSLAGSLRVPVVLTEHSGPFTVHLKTRLDRAVVGNSLGAFAAVIAVSPMLAADIRAIRDVPIDIVGNIVDTDFFTPAKSSVARRNGEFRVVTVSSLVRSKRVDVVINAVAEAARTTARRIGLTVVGDGPERRPLERLAADLRVGPSVRFVGVADRDIVREELRAADAFVLASESETFGIVAGEAMACGTPVVVSLNGGSQFVVERDLGIHVPVGSSSAIASAIEAIMNGTAQIDLERARASIVRRFSPSSVVSDLERIYERVSLPSRPRSAVPPSTLHFVS